METAITLAVEGPIDGIVMQRLVAEVGLKVAFVHGERGKDHLDAQMRGFNRAAERARWLVLRDLDQDADCAPALVARLLPTPARHMRFRIAVRATEAWLLADRDGLSRFLRVSAARVPPRPDDIDRPKQFLVDLARKSGSSGIRRDMVPAAGSSARVGPLYVARIAEFVKAHWQPRQAERASDSLARCLRDIEEWAPRTPASGS